MATITGPNGEERWESSENDAVKSSELNSNEFQTVKQVIRIPNLDKLQARPLTNDVNSMSNRASLRSKISQRADEYDMRRAKLSRDHHSMSVPALVIPSSPKTSAIRSKLSPMRSSISSPKTSVSPHKIVSQLMDIEAKSKHQIIDDITKRTAKPFENLKIFPKDEESTLKQSSDKSSFVLSSTRLKENRELDKSQLLEMQAQQFTLMKYKALNKIEHVKVTNPEFYNFSIRIKTSRDRLLWKYNIFIGHRKSEPNVIFSGVSLDAEGYAIIGDTGSTVFESAKYFDWITRPRDLLEVGFRITIVGVNPNDSPKSPVSSLNANNGRKLADCLFMFDEFERVVLIDNIDVSGSPTKHVLKRTSTTRYDHTSIIKKNLSVYRDMNEKAKVKVLNCVRNGLESLAILFVLNSKESETKPVLLSVPQLRPYPLTARRNEQRSHKYYEFGVNRFGSNQHSPKKKMDESSEEERVKTERNTGLSITIPNSSAHSSQFIRGSITTRSEYRNPILLLDKESKLNHEGKQEDEDLEETIRVTSYASAPINTGPAFRFNGSSHSATSTSLLSTTTVTQTPESARSHKRLRESSPSRQLFSEIDQIGIESRPVSLQRQNQLKRDLHLPLDKVFQRKKQYRVIDMRNMPSPARTWDEEYPNPKTY